MADIIHHEVFSNFKNIRYYELSSRHERKKITVTHWDFFSCFAYAYVSGGRWKDRLNLINSPPFSWIIKIAFLLLSNGPTVIIDSLGGTTTKCRCCEHSLTPRYEFVTQMRVLVVYDLYKINGFLAWLYVSTMHKIASLNGLSWQHIL